jgi:hypothetical protein
MVTRAGLAQLRPAKRTRSKYGNKKVTVDGIRFDSKREAKRYGELKLMQMAGEISDLCLQVRYPLVVNEVKIGFYIADFVYWDKNVGISGQEIVEDSKGCKTPVYNVKKKLMKAIHNIDIYET